MDDDVELLVQWADGSEAAAEQLIERHMPALYRFFHTKVPDGAEDMVQETFLAAVQRRGRLTGSFRAYLFGIARNLLFRRFRTLVRTERKHQLAAMSVDDVMPSPTGAFAARDEVGVLLRALRRIPIDFQIVIELFYWEQLGTAEIAEVLEIAPGTVKSRLSRAREALKTAIEAAESDAEVRHSTSDRLEHWAARLKARISGEASEDGNEGDPSA